MILIALAIYILYRFIVGFVIPVVQTTAQVRRQFNAMKEQMDSARGQQQETESDHIRTRMNGGGRTTSGKPGAHEDYIEFEELR